MKIEIIAPIKDVIEASFYLLAGVIAVLTYIQARKTIFTPLKTETFKLQLKYFEEVLSVFGKFEENNIESRFDFSKIFYGNARFMLDDYAATFFKDQLKPDEEKMKLFKEEFVGGIISKEHIEKNLEKVTSPLKMENKVKEEQNLSAAIVLAKWTKYEYCMIEYTSGFQKESDRHHKLISLPLLPTDLKKLIENFNEKIHSNVLLIGKVLTEISQELPDKYSTADDLLKSDLDWMWNRYNSEKEDVEPHRKKITEYISNYLDVDGLLK